MDSGFEPGEPSKNRQNFTFWVRPEESALLPRDIGLADLNGYKITFSAGYAVGLTVNGLFKYSEPTSYKPDTAGLIDLNTSKMLSYFYEDRNFV